MGIIGVTMTKLKSLEELVEENLPINPPPTGTYQNSNAIFLTPKRWYTCRERFGAASGKLKYFYFFCNSGKLKNIFNFLEDFQTIAKIKKKDQFLVKQFEDKHIGAIILSYWWRANLRKSLLTALIRIGENYIRSNKSKYHALMHTIQHNSFYGNPTYKAIKLFISGRNEYIKKRGRGGWVNTFRNKNEDKIKEILLTSEEFNKILTKADLPAIPDHIKTPKPPITTTYASSTIKLKITGGVWTNCRESAHTTKGSRIFFYKRDEAVIDKIIKFLRDCQSKMLLSPVDRFIARKLDKYTGVIILPSWWRAGLKTSLLTALIKIGQNYDGNRKTIFDCIQKNQKYGSATVEATKMFLEEGFTTIKSHQSRMWCETFRDRKREEIAKIIHQEKSLNFLNEESSPEPQLANLCTSLGNLPE